MTNQKLFDAAVDKMAEEQIESTEKLYRQLIDKNEMLDMAYTESRQIFDKCKIERPTDRMMNLSYISYKLGIIKGLAAASELEENFDFLAAKKILHTFDKQPIAELYDMMMNCRGKKTQQ